MNLVIDTLDLHRQRRNQMNVGGNCAISDHPAYGSRLQYVALSNLINPTTVVSYLSHPGKPAHKTGT